MHLRSYDTNSQLLLEGAPGQEWGCHCCRLRVIKPNFGTSIPHLSVTHHHPPHTHQPSTHNVHPRSMPHAPHELQHAPREHEHATHEHKHASPKRPDSCWFTGQCCH